MKTQCRNCGAKFKAPDLYKGREVKCPKCKEKFILTELADLAKPRISSPPLKRPDSVSPIAPRGEEVIATPAAQTPGPHGPQQAVIVNVPAQKAVSGFGIASLVLGVFACLTCWLPYLGCSALPLGLLGILFGVIGIIASLSTRRSLAGLPGAGVVVSAVAVIIFIAVTGAVSDAVTKGLEEAPTTFDQPPDRTMWDTPDSLDESYATYLLPTYRRAVDTEPAEEPIHGAKEQREKKAYFSKVEIRDLHVAKDAFDDWAVFGEVKNIGDRTLTKVEITIYYLDRYGDPVYEQVQRPVHCSAWLSDDQPLKPNYSQKFGYEADDAPSEWAREIRGVVSDIEFEE